MLSVTAGWVVVVGGRVASRGGYLFPCCTGPSASLNHSLLQHVQRDFGVGSRESFPWFSATNITGRVRYSRPAVGVTLQWSCRHVRLVTAHIFTPFQLNQQLNIHAYIKHVRKQIRLTLQTRRNSHYREVNCTHKTPKSDYFTLFTPSVRPSVWPYVNTHKTNCKTFSDWGHTRGRV